MPIEIETLQAIRHFITLLASVMILLMSGGAIGFFCLLWLAKRRDEKR